MKSLASALAMAALTAGAAADAAEVTRLTRADVDAVAPALDAYNQAVLLGDLWKRPGLGMRDRSLVTLAALIARGQVNEMSFYLNRALDSGLKPREVSETITHLAFYSGFPNAMAAVAVAKDVFAARRIGADQLPVVSPKLLPLDEESEARRADSVGSSSPPLRPGSWPTRPTCCSATCGCAPTWRHATAAWSPSVR